MSKKEWETLKIVLENWWASLFLNLHNQLEWMKKKLHNSLQEPQDNLQVHQDNLMRQTPKDNKLLMIQEWKRRTNDLLLDFDTLFLFYFST